MDAIVAVYEDWGIGAEGTQPVALSADRRYFREKTQNAWVIVGRKTLGDFPGGRPLPNRVNLVLTRGNPEIPEPGLSTARGKPLQLLPVRKRFLSSAEPPYMGPCCPSAPGFMSPRWGLVLPPMYSSPIWTKTRTGSAPMPALSAGRREFPTVFVYTPGAHIGFDSEFPHFSIFVARSIWTNGHLWDIMKP